MTTRISVTRVICALIAAAALAWQVDAVNTHSNDAQQGLQNALQHSSAAATTRTSSTDGAGLDLVDMFQCMCASNEDMRPWVRWWLVAAIFGGIPIAVLLRSRTESQRT